MTTTNPLVTLAFTLVLVLAPTACGRSTDAPPSTPEPVAAPPAKAAPALRWFTNPCETPGPQACQIADPVDVPDNRLPRCSAIGALDGDGCKQEHRRCIFIPQQRDRLSACTEPARHLICAKRPPGRMCN